MASLHVTLKELQAGVPVPLDERTTIVVVPPTAMLTLLGRAFDAGKSFPLPRALSKMGELFETVLRFQAKQGLVVGHVSSSDADPETLSEERALMMKAWLEDTPEPWVANYEASVDETTRWGAREDRLMLVSVLGNEQATGASAGASLVEQFQTRHSDKLVVDGIIGPKTRTQLVKEYFALSANAILQGQEPAEGSALKTVLTAHAAGANFSLQQVEEAREEAKQVDAGGDGDATGPNGVASDSPDEGTEAKVASDQDSAQDEDESTETAPPAIEPPPGDARIDVILFFQETGIDPAPAGADGSEYLDWVKQAEFFRNFSVDAGGVGNQLCLLLTDKTGQVPLRRAKYELLGPETFSGVTDDQGRIDHDDVLPGDYELKLTLEFFADPEKNDPGDKIVDEYRSPVLTQAGNAAPQIRMIGAVPRCTKASIRGLLFDTNKAFLLPTALEDLKKIRAVYEEHNPSELLVVGHTDTTSAPAVNDPLSLKRAKAALAFLQDDVATWETFYTSAVSESQRWGEPEDELMRQAIVQERPGTDVLSLSRSELIRAYMRLDGVELDSGEFQIKASVHGCGENFPVNDSGEQLDDAPENEKEDALDRRVEFFFFETEFGIVPKPHGDNSAKSSKQYPAWRDLAEDTLEIISGRGNNRFFLRFHIDPGDADSATERLRLFSTNGEYEALLTIKTDGERREEFVDLEFVGVFSDLSYTLEVTPEGDESYLLFESVPFADLDELTEPNEEFEDPDPLEPEPGTDEGTDEPQSEAAE